MFLFIFLILWIIANVSNGNYLLLIGFIPFWLLIVFLLKNKFLGKDNKMIVYLFLCILIFAGFLFIMVPFIIIIRISSKIKERFINLNIVLLLTGIVFLTTGLIFLYMTTGTISIIKIYKTFSPDDLFLYITLSMFILFGIFIIFKSFNRNNE